ncbi:MAG: NYN domain-containing protein [Acidimicrobiales bacterium]
MASEVFDRLIERAVDIARSGSTPAPPRIQSILGFRRLPDRAKDDVLEVLDSDEGFRSAVRDESDESDIGRAGMLFVERPDGWREQIDRLVSALDEPIVERSADRRRLERRAEAAEAALSRLEAALNAAAEERDRLQVDLDAAIADRTRLDGALAAAEADRVRLAEERKRAVSELKTTEAVLARHVDERKRLEHQLADMTAAQLSTMSAGGRVTDEQVRAEVDRLETLVANLGERLTHLRSMATPERVRVARRTALPLPPAVFDDSIEAAEYLVRIPGITVLVDGYNVTKEAQPELALDAQRDWLENRLIGLAARTNARFEVVFDGASVVVAGSGRRDPAVRISYSPEGVEADDVIIDRVAAMAADRAVVVVSSDRRVRDGAESRGANLLHARQLITLIS